MRSPTWFMVIGIWGMFWISWLNLFFNPNSGYAQLVFFSTLAVDAFFVFIINRKLREFADRE